MAAGRSSLRLDDLPAARSQARHMYQLATERHGPTFCAALHLSGVEQVAA